MALTAGTRLGPYEIEEMLGAGGMGEVYKAQDTRLDRIVAIKILPPQLAGDPLFRERFDREARTISQLDHPHICAVYDVGQQNGTAYLVMQYLEGETLADRLSKSALTLDHALRIAIEVADALDRAHRAGIVHRDLKPGNVFLTKTGAKLLDFGLAKVNRPVLSGTGASMLPTTAQITQPGTILGTLRYMAPEQLEGKEADARTDIFAFGVVVYEMLTGKKAFDGKSQASVIAAIMSYDPPPMSTSQPLTPPPLDHLVKTCLAKDPEERWQSAADVMRQLRWCADRGAARGTTVSPVGAIGKRERLAWAAVAAVAAATATGMSLFLVDRTRPEPAATIRFHVSPPTGTRFTLGPAAPHMAVSPDGRRMAFVVVDRSDRRMLAVQSFDALHAQLLPGTDLAPDPEGAGLPFWSPDSRFIGFFAQGKLMKIDVKGGQPQFLCNAPSGEGGTWSSDGTILFAQSPTSGLVRVADDGGIPTPVTILDSGRKEVSHRWPWFLPDGRHFLYVTTAPTKVYVGSLDSQEHVELLESDSKALYSAGHLLFVRERTLLAQPFDAVRLTLTGESFPVAEDVAVNSDFTRAAFSVSMAGMLAYRTAPIGRRRLVWVDRSSGKQVGVLGDPDAYTELELAPDGARAAVTIRDTDTSDDIWIFDTARGVRIRPLTSDPAGEVSPRWSPGGDQIVFMRRGAKPGLYLKSSSGTGGEELLLAFDGRREPFPESWSPDGRFLLYSWNDPKTMWDLWTLALANQKRSPVVQMAARQEFGRFSPNGRWVAYRSTETGRSEVFVVSFPDVGAPTLISTAGGTFPRWRQDGRELFYLTPDNTLMVAAVNGQGREFQVGTVQPVFTRAHPSGGTYPYEVSPDGQRFLDTTLLEAQESSITVVTNWTVGLKN